MDYTRDSRNAGTISDGLGRPLAMNLSLLLPTDRLCPGLLFLFVQRGIDMVQAAGHDGSDVIGICCQGKAGIDSTDHCCHDG